ncbi:MAG TPA: serine/threonine-protein kinase [Actinomycetota bacterium]|nr:serine/threonine-protein kinase [Actinomycetota bacterium]
MAEGGGVAGPGRAAPLGPGDPARVGPYELLGRLGAGGMGTVYLGRGGDGEQVAVKVLRPELAGDPSFLRMFRHEVAAARRVVGFCTARVIDAELSGALPYLVTEYVDGVRLDRAVAASGRLPATDLAGLAVGMAAALTAIHGAGVVHRDLKPSNVLLSYFGPKVIDFGIARALDASAASTATGRLMGSPGWMAPEQFAQAPVTAAVDIFVWGSLVAFAGTGRRPFGQGTVVEIVYRIRHEPPDLGGLEGRLRELVEGCMDKDPERRPSARTLLLELLGDHADPDPQAAATQLLQRSWSPPPPAADAAPAADPVPAAVPIPVPAPAAPPPAPPPPARPGRPRRRRAVWRLVLLGVVAGAAALAVTTLDPLDRSPAGDPGPATVAPTGPTTATSVPSPPPLCELLGDLGAGGTLGGDPADQGFTAPGEAAGSWLPVPAALPRALGDHGFQSGCTRTWPGPAGPVVASLFQFPSRDDALAMRGQLRDDLGRRGVPPDRLPEVTGGELYLLERGGGSGQLVMFVCNERVLQLHLDAAGPGPDPRLVRLGQGANRRLSDRTGCPL